MMKVPTLWMNIIILSSCIGLITADLSQHNGHSSNTTYPTVAAAGAARATTPTEKPPQGVQMVITPNVAFESVDRNVQLFCSVNHSNLNTKYEEILVVSIVKDEKNQIAIMRPGSGISMGNNALANRFRVKDSLETGGSALYLKLDLPQPRTVDRGEYSCAVVYLSTDGMLKQDITSERLFVQEFVFPNNPLLASLVKSIIRREETEQQQQNDKIVKLEKKIKLLHGKIQQTKQEQQMNDKIMKLDRKIKYTQKTMRQTEKQLNGKITKLEKKIKNQEGEMRQVFEQMNTTISAFSATIKEKKRKTPLHRNKTIIFDDVISKQGQCYDESTGVFTALKPGLYSFYVTISAWSHRKIYTEVDIMVNDNPRQRLQAFVDNYFDFGYTDLCSTGIIVELNGGDFVRVVASASTAENQEFLNGALSTFSGYLIREYIA